MAQTIKFVFESGKIRIQRTAVDITKNVCKDLQHDYAQPLAGGGMDKVKYFVLTDGDFAPEPPVKKNKGHKHYHNVRG